MLEGRSTLQNAQRVKRFIRHHSTFLPLDHSGLLRQFQNSLAEDFSYRTKQQSDSPTVIERVSTFLLLQDIQSGLLTVGKSLNDFQLPSPNPEDNCLLPHKRKADCIETDTVQTRRHLLCTIVSRKLILNDEQRIPYNHIVDCIKKKLPGLYFLDAPGGTGKTFLLNLFIDISTYYDVPTKSTASSGIAANLLINGSTCHSAFKLPSPPMQNTASHSSLLQRH
eukprot:GHVS01072116.1.p1 GENE.GHVS01072116.1~~GHVS01072116.1.p1  ORF type:complete len:223 (+),score=6.41 GHVS01072116.1:267-935(+)